MSVPSDSSVQTPQATEAAAAPKSDFDFKAQSTDYLLERLPNNLHLARNDNAPEHDRWRIYNKANGEYIAPGHHSAREALISLLTRMANASAKWTAKEPS